jgi:hypothetical protein
VAFGQALVARLRKYRGGDAQSDGETLVLNKYQAKAGEFA